MKPQIEQLDARINPSSVTLSNHVITITGDSAVNQVAVVVTDVGYDQPKVIVDLDNIHKVWNLSNVTAINATLNGGGDYFEYLNNPSDDTTDYPRVDDSHLTVTVNGSGGHDGIVVGFGSATYVVNGGSGDDVIDLGGCTGPATLKGGAGDDLIDGSDGACLIDGGAGDDQILCGDGADTVYATAGNDVVIAQDGAGYGAPDVIYYSAGATVFHDPEDTLILV